MLIKPENKDKDRRNIIRTGQKKKQKENLNNEKEQEEEATATK